MKEFILLIFLQVNEIKGFYDRHSRNVIVSL